MFGLDTLDLAGTALGTLRLLGLFLVAPIFGHQALSPRIRIALAFAISFGMGAIARPDIGSLQESALAGAVVSELAIGLTLGFATRLVFAAFDLVGEIMSIQGGLGAATVLDPSSGASSVALASFLHVVATLIYLAMDGHHVALQTMAMLFERLPLGHTLGTHVFAEIVSLGAMMFEIGMRLAAPITAAMLLANLGVGVLGRVMPQLNLMTVQLPALVGLTLLLFGLGSSTFIDASGGVLTDWMTGVAELMSGAG